MRIRLEQDEVYKVIRERYGDGQIQLHFYCPDLAHTDKRTPPPNRSVTVYGDTKGKTHQLRKG